MSTVWLVVVPRSDDPSARVDISRTTPSIPDGLLTSHRPAISSGRKTGRCVYTVVTGQLLTIAESASELPLVASAYSNRHREGCSWCAFRSPIGGVVAEIQIFGWGAASLSTRGITGLTSESSSSALGYRPDDPPWLLRDQPWRHCVHEGSGGVDEKARSIRSAGVSSRSPCGVGPGAGPWAVPCCWRPANGHSPSVGTLAAARSQSTRRTIGPHNHMSASVCCASSTIRTSFCYRSRRSPQC
jgi:hypothetical protein